jgi:hypothetical protein
MKEAIKDWFSGLVEDELEDKIANDDRVSSIAIVVLCVFFVFFFVAHQTSSTGFFTATFGTSEMLLLYGSLIFWIVTSALMLFGRKDASRNLDSFGGLAFTTVGYAWLFVVFPFEFAHFADVVPDFLRFLVQWISDDIARVLMVLGFIVHLVFAVFSLIMRVSVLKARAQQN